MDGAEGPRLQPRLSVLLPERTAESLRRRVSDIDSPTAFGRRQIEMRRRRSSARRTSTVGRRASVRRKSSVRRLSPTPGRSRRSSSKRPSGRLSGRASAGLLAGVPLLLRELAQNGSESSGSSDSGDELAEVAEEDSSGDSDSDEVLEFDWTRGRIKGRPRRSQESPSAGSDEAPPSLWQAAKEWRTGQRPQEQRESDESEGEEEEARLRAMLARSSLSSSSSSSDDESSGDEWTEDDEEEDDDGTITFTAATISPHTLLRQSPHSASARAIARATSAHVSLPQEQQTRRSALAELQSAPDARELNLALSPLAMRPPDDADAGAQSAFEAAQQRRLLRSGRPAALPKLNVHVIERETVRLDASGQAFVAKSQMLALAEEIPDPYKRLQLPVPRQHGFARTRPWWGPSEIPLMPCLAHPKRVPTELERYPEPVRDRDKDWRLDSQRAVLDRPWVHHVGSAVVTRKPRQRLGRWNWQDRGHSFEWSGKIGAMVRKELLWRAGALVSGAYVILTVYGIGVSGRVHTAGDGFGRALRLVCYTPDDCRKYTVDLDMMKLTRLFASDGISEQNLLQPGHKADLVVAISRKLFFTKTRFWRSQPMPDAPDRIPALGRPPPGSAAAAAIAAAAAAEKAAREADAPPPRPVERASDYRRGAVPVMQGDAAAALKLIARLKTMATKVSRRPREAAAPRILKISAVTSTAPPELRMREHMRRIAADELARRQKRRRGGREDGVPMWRAGAIVQQARKLNGFLCVVSVHEFPDRYGALVARAYVPTAGNTYELTINNAEAGNAVGEPLPPLSWDRRVKRRVCQGLVRLMRLRTGVDVVSGAQTTLMIDHHAGATGNMLQLAALRLPERPRPIKRPGGVQRDPAFRAAPVGLLQARAARQRALGPPMRLVGVERLSSRAIRIGPHRGVYTLDMLPDQATLLFRFYRPDTSRAYDVPLSLLKFNALTKEPRDLYFKALKGTRQALLEQHVARQARIADMRKELRKLRAKEARSEALRAQGLTEADAEDMAENDNEDVSSLGTFALLKAKGMLIPGVRPGSRASSSDDSSDVEEGSVSGELSLEEASLEEGSGELDGEGSGSGEVEGEGSGEVEQGSGEGEDGDGGGKRRKKKKHKKKKGGEEPEQEQEEEEQEQHKKKKKKKHKKHQKKSKKVSGRAAALEAERKRKQRQAARAAAKAKAKAEAKALRRANRGIVRRKRIAELDETIAALAFDEPRVQAEAQAAWDALAQELLRRMHWGEYDLLAQSEAPELEGQLAAVHAREEELERKMLTATEYHIQQALERQLDAVSAQVEELTLRLQEVQASVAKRTANGDAVHLALTHHIYSGAQRILVGEDEYNYYMVDVEQIDSTLLVHFYDPRTCEAFDHELDPAVAGALVEEFFKSTFVQRGAGLRATLSSLSVVRGEGGEVEVKFVL